MGHGNFGGDQRNHLTLAVEEFQHRTGFMPRGGWVVWVDLYAEALSCGLPKRQAHLEWILKTGPTVNGWGQMRLVEAMKGEVKPDGPTPGALLGLGINVNPMQQAQEPQRPKKRSLSDRVLGR